MPTPLKTVFAVLLALPFGWGLGVLVAWIIAGPDFGQLPALTVGLGVIASIVFALRSSIPINTRLLVMFVGSIALIAIVRMLP